MSDCCKEKAEARRYGAFEGPVGDDWYRCEACEAKHRGDVEQRIRQNIESMARAAAARVVAHIWKDLSFWGKVKFVIGARFRR